MSAKHPLALQADALCRDVIEAQGVDLLETAFLKEDGEWFLRFYIDKRGGVSMDDCVAVSRAIDPIIEEQLHTKATYNLDVSSPGLDRPLKTAADFQRHLGEWVEISLYQPREGSKQYIGWLEAYDEATGEVTLTQENGQRLTFPAEQRAKTVRAIRF